VTESARERVERRDVAERERRRRVADARGTSGEEGVGMAGGRREGGGGAAGRLRHAGGVIAAGRRYVNRGDGDERPK
jgi:hypothetical protein